MPPTLVEITTTIYLHSLKAMKRLVLNSVDYRYIAVGVYVCIHCYATYTIYATSIILGTYMQLYVYVSKWVPVCLL